MSSANNKDKKPLEDVFRHHMRDAEATPIPDLWARIDHDLTVQENARYKKRIVYYRQLAAACFILFVMAGAVLLYQFNAPERNAGSMAVQEKEHTGSSEVAQRQQPAIQNENPLSSSTSGSAVPDNTGAIALIETQESIAQSNPESKRGATGNYNTQQRTSGSQNRSVIASNTSTARAGSIKEGKSTDIETSSADNLLTNPESKQLAAASAGEQTTQQRGNETGQTILLKNPAVLSLLAKEREKAKTYAFDNQEDTNKQTEALVSEFNKEVKEKKQDGSSTSRWSMSMAYMPTYFAQNIGLPDPMAVNRSNPGILMFGPAISAEGSANMEKAREEYDTNTEPAFSYAVDLKTGFKLGKKLKLLAGIGFNQNAARTKSSYVVEQHWSGKQFARSAPIPASNIFMASLGGGFAGDSISVSQTEPYEINHRYRMVSLPVGLQFENEIVNGWNWYMSGIVAANIMLESSVSSSRGEVANATYENDEEESPFRRTQFSGNVGLGVSKQVTDAVSLSLGPEFRGYFNTMLSEPEKVMATQGKPYAIGLNMSLNYQLGSLKK